METARVRRRKSLTPKYQQKRGSKSDINERGNSSEQSLTYAIDITLKQTLRGKTYAYNCVNNNRLHDSSNDIPVKIVSLFAAERTEAQYVNIITMTIIVWHGYYGIFNMI